MAPVRLPLSLFQGEADYRSLRLLGWCLGPSCCFGDRGSSRPKGPSLPFSGSPVLLQVLPNGGHTASFLVAGEARGLVDSCRFPSVTCSCWLVLGQCDGDTQEGSCAHFRQDWLPGEKAEEMPAPGGCPQSPTVLDNPSFQWLSVTDSKGSPEGPAGLVAFVLATFPD